jgi:hypothetical protein
VVGWYVESWDLMAEIRRKPVVGEMGLEPGYGAWRRDNKNVNVMRSEIK